MLQRIENTLVIINRFCNGNCHSSFGHSATIHDDRLQVYNADNRMIDAIAIADIESTKIECNESRMILVIN